MQQLLLEEVQRAVDDLDSRPNVVRLADEEIKRRAQLYGTPTAFGNYGWVSTVKNRSTALTLHLGSRKVASEAFTQKKKEIRKGATETARLVHEYLRKAPLLHVSCTMGDNPDFAPGCELYLSVYRKETIRLAYMLQQTLFAFKESRGPRLKVIFIPEWQEKDRQILVFPEIGVTYVLGTDYFGELRNAFLRMAMWSAKQEGMLGLHAGTKIVCARGADGKLRRLGMVLFGIEATGKTTHICHNHGLCEDGEGVEIVQDEVVFWRKDGSALGTERGFYIKTEGLDPKLQPLLYAAATSKNALLDNVVVDYEGNTYFADRTLTANGHALIQSQDLCGLGKGRVNLPPLCELDGILMAFMTRNYTVVPVVSKLAPEQAAVAFMLGESLDVTGADAKDAMSPGKAAGTNPLLVGEASAEANMFYELVKAHEDKIHCYMLNTGGVGELVEHRMDGARRLQKRVTRVSIPEMASIIRAIARGSVNWREDPDWMVETPLTIDGVNISKFNPAAHYDQGKIDALIAAIRLERAGYAEAFSGLDPKIRAAVEF